MSDRGADRDPLRRELRNAGLTTDAIDAVWPEWWSSEADYSLSARAELRYTVARRLGIRPSTLFDGAPEFVLRDALYKNLGTTDERQRSILSSFGSTVGRMAIAGIEQRDPIQDLTSITALQLRQAILTSSSYVGLGEILSTCWSLGIPVLHPQIRPLSSKRMHAMSVKSGDRYAIIVSRNTKFLAQAAFAIAHEMGHIFSGHLDNTLAYLDIGDPLTAREPDSDELAADRFALALLTGSERPQIVSTRPDFTSAQLAAAAVSVGPRQGVSPGTIALALGYATKRWPQCIGALQLIPGETSDEYVGEAINSVAETEVSWSSLTREQEDYLRKVIGRVN